MAKPNFLFIGPDKSGSSWLFRMLSLHPECYVPPCKDIYFFDRYYDRGMAWYLAFFKKAPPTARAVGEFSHDYLFSPLAAERIGRDLPGVHLLTTLRNPVERTFSHYLYLVRSGMTRAPFEEALERHPELIRNSMYHIHLQEYLRRFGPSRIKILLFDLLQSAPQAFAREAFAFLGLPFLESIDYHQHVRAADRPLNHYLARAAKWGACRVRDLGMPRLVGAVKHCRPARLLYRPYGKGNRPQMNPSTKSRLEERFLPGIRRLEEMLGIELSGWSPEKGEPGR